jgi:hypothetical protein
MRNHTDTWKGLQWIARTRRWHTLPTGFLSQSGSPDIRTALTVMRAGAISSSWQGPLQFQCKRSSAPVGNAEIKHRLRYLVACNKASAHFIRDVHGHITGPSLGCIEGDDADRVVELTLYQIADHRLAVSSMLVGLSPRPPDPAKVFQHEVSVSGLWGAMDCEVGSALSNSGASRPFLLRNIRKTLRRGRKRGTLLGANGCIFRLGNGRDTRWSTMARSGTWQPVLSLQFRSLAGWRTSSPARFTD